MKRALYQLLVAGVLFAGISVTAASNETVSAKAAAVERSGVVYVIPIQDQIEPALLYVIRRGANEAVEAKADAVIFEMDTPGGTLGAAEDICRVIQSLPMPTYTLVKKNAFSAGAIIALATKHIYMEPGSVIGDAMPIMMGMFGGVEEMPDDIKEKMTSGVAALIRANAQLNGYDPELAECMVRIEKEYSISNEFTKKEGHLLTLTNLEAEKKVGPEKKSLLSSGTVKDLPELLEKAGLPGDQVRRLEVTSAERIARWLAAIAPLLLMAGLLGIYIEFKTPGVVLPGLLGGICLVLFFWGHHIAGLTGMEEVLLFVVGIAFILVEIYVFPGHILPGLIGVVCVFAALLMAMTPHLPNAPAIPEWPDLTGPARTLTITIIGTGLIAMWLAKVLPHGKLASPLVLKMGEKASDGFVSMKTEASLVGQTGEAVSMLRPAGLARFGDRQLDVVTRGDFVKPGARVRIVEVQGSRIVVEAV